MPSRVVVAIEVPADRRVVWEELARLEGHVEWMADVESLEFLSDTTRGVGTRVRVATRFGPLRTSDIMVFTAWEPPIRMAVDHRGLFTGKGEFRLESIAADRTLVTWRELIRFPWYFGGPFGARLARPVFRWVWRRNLRRLRGRLAG